MKFSIAGLVPTITWSTHRQTLVIDHQPLETVCEFWLLLRMWAAIVDLFSPAWLAGWW
jgi:hypothetical protein